VVCSQINSSIFERIADFELIFLISTFRHVRGSKTEVPTTVVPTSRMFTAPLTFSSLLNEQCCKRYCWLASGYHFFSHCIASSSVVCSKINLNCSFETFCGVRKVSSFSVFHYHSPQNQSKFWYLNFHLNQCFCLLNHSAFNFELLWTALNWCPSMIQFISKLQSEKNFHFRVCKTNKNWKKFFLNFTLQSLTFQKHRKNLL
jgi:hypothetical protein